MAFKRQMGATGEESKIAFAIVLFSGMIIHSFPDFYDTRAFASLGVYLRDLSQVIGMATTVALFLAPVFYPIDALPEAYRVS